MNPLIQSHWLSHGAASRDEERLVCHEKVMKVK